MKKFVLALIITVIGFASFADQLIKAESWLNGEKRVVTEEAALIEIEAEFADLLEYQYDSQSVLTDKHAYWLDKYKVPTEYGTLIVHLTYFRW